ncbi:SDR family oxidoreductase [Halobacillus sp. GSS1]|uniref:SDR family oxidoreductase n=1 Tax=Halobacillus sp. GSS1 TaxID=2815919 RepID=UPI001A8EBE0E|nr:SDR family oxidoreductase [Halobacillus sp. GSS1]MBN9653400.1 SDR family oxidoreductase [Halobacillus sp. GSS1]
MKYNITAATGHLGEKITEELLKLVSKEEAAITVRNHEKAKQLFGDSVNIKKADYHSEEEMTEAFMGTDVLIYIPSFSFPSHVRINEFEKAVNAAEKANVKQFLFVGFVADHENSPFQMSPFFGYVPRRLASSQLSYTMVRNGMYADPLPSYLPELMEHGQLPYPAGDGKINFVSRRDIARAVVQIATRPELYEKKYTLTGQRAYSMEELASIFSEISGETIRYSPMSFQEFAVTYDEPEGFGPVLTSLYTAASRHLMDETTDDIETVTGDPSEDLTAFIKQNFHQEN